MGICTFFCNIEKLKITRYELIPLLVCLTSSLRPEEKISSYLQRAIQYNTVQRAITILYPAQPAPSASRVDYASIRLPRWPQTRSHPVAGSLFLLLLLLHSQPDTTAHYHSPDGRRQSQHNPHQQLQSTTTLPTTPGSTSSPSRRAARSVIAHVAPAASRHVKETSGTQLRQRQRSSSVSRRHSCRMKARRRHRGEKPGGGLGACGGGSDTLRPAG